MEGSELQLCLPEINPNIPTVNVTWSGDLITQQSKINQISMARKRVSHER
jgi:hypothetical protein